MAGFKLHCETCSFEQLTASLDDALDIEADHKAQHGSAHRVSIKRRPKP